MEPRPFISTLLILLFLPVYGLSEAHAPSQDSPASTPAPSIGSEDGGKNSGGSSSKVNILAAVLVTASSLMVFVAFKYSICGCARSSDSSTGSESENESIQDDVESSTVATNVVSSGNTGVVVESKKKKPSSKFVVESIDKFTILADFESLTRNNKVVVSSRSCSVCLCEFRSESEIRVLPSCRHFFHPDCIDVWLVSNMTCPVCRRNVIPSGGEVGSSTGE